MKKLVLFLLAAVLGSTTLPQNANAQAPESGAVKPTRKADPMKPIEDVTGLPRVLIIGDSISIGYTLPVRALLKDKANVHRILTNGSATKNGLENLKKWLGDSKWDVIHFNWGLHDIKFVEDKQNVPHRRLRKELARIGDATQSHQREADLVQHNARARRQNEPASQKFRCHRI